MHKRRHRNMRVFDFVFNFVRPHREGDITDRINYFVTSFILLSMAATLGARLYLSPTINCYLPAETTKNQEEYIEQMCFAKNTYYVPHEKSVPERERERNEVRYPIYQWSPFILCIQAVLFYAPRWLWKLFSSLSDFDVKQIMSGIREWKERGDGAVALMAKSFEDTIFRRMYFGGGNYLRGRYLTLVYLVTKVISLTNAVGQFYLINTYLKTQKSWLWGVEVLNDMVKGADLSESRLFPRKTYCDIEIRDIGNTHRRTLECLLLMNIFIEKIFLFLWFWLIMVISVTSASLIYWVTFTFLRCIRQSFIRAAVLSSTTSPQNLLSRQQQLTQKNFQDEWLKHDGLLLLHFVSLNSSKNLAAQLIDLLYKGFQDWKSDHSGSRKIAVKVTEDVDTLWYNSSSADSRLARNQV